MLRSVGVDKLALMCHDRTPSLLHKGPQQRHIDGGLPHCQHIHCNPDVCCLLCELLEEGLCLFGCLHIIWALPAIKVVQGNAARTLETTSICYLSCVSLVQSLANYSANCLETKKLCLSVCHWFKVLRQIFHADCLEMKKLCLSVCRCLCRL